jgi:hypothetical protein
MPDRDLCSGRMEDKVDAGSGGCAGPLAAWAELLAR